MPLPTAAFWRNIAPVASIGIVLAAAVFSGLQWLDARDQAFLTTKPHVDFDTEDDSDQPIVGIAIMNAGPGPALIKSVSFYVDRKPVADADEWDALTPSCRLPNSIIRS
jgi:hypothetical protein